MAGLRFVGDYDLARLGPQEFQSLCQAVAIKQFGPATRVFGMGRDGGRDAVNNGPVRISNDELWVGYTVIQVKFRARPASSGDNARWLRNEVRKELLEWAGEGRAKLKKPKNILFMTNVTLSGVPGRGLDSLDGVFEAHPLDLPLKRADVWHYDHICRLLDDAADIRTRYAGFITPGDVLSELHRVLSGRASQMGDVIRRHAEKELLAEQWIRLGQAGSRTNDKLQLTQVAMDLPLERDATNAAKPAPAVATVVRLGDRNLRPSARGVDGPHPHLVLVGGPGQGKTTISQLISQAYRTALLSESMPQAANVRTALETHRTGLPQRGLPTPVAKRWPLRIDLATYADRISGAPDTSVLRYLAERIEVRTDEHVTPAQLRDWLAAWPWILILDGFDEVAAPTVRETLVQRVSEFLDDAEEADADLLLIATTRPRGYAGEFSTQQYTHLTLADLPPEMAIRYATTLAKIRLEDDPDALETVVAGLDSAVRKDVTARLMTTPLQVTIMSLLLENPAGVPTQRHALFDGYYQTIYAREIAKRTPVSALLERHRGTIDALHNAIALEVGVSSEHTGHADPAIPRQRVEVITRQILLAEEHSVGEADDLGDQLFRAATERLVLLVPKNDSDVGFEIRSLQEYLAARQLTSGSDAAILDRLKRIAPSAFWRNTWLLAAGRVATERSHITSDVVGILSELDAQDMLAYQLGLGAELAADLLDDGFGYPSPRITRQLINIAVEAFRGHLTSATLPTADALQRAAAGDVAGVSRRLRAAARAAAGAQPPQQVTAIVIANRWEQRTGTVAATGRQIIENLRSELQPTLLEALKQHFVGTAISGRTTSQPLRVRPAQSLAEHLGFDASAAAENDQVAARAFVKALRATKVQQVLHDATGREALTVPSVTMPDLEVLEDSLGRESVTEALSDALLELPPEKWAIASATVQIAAQWARSRRVGPGIDLPHSLSVLIDGSARG